MPMAMMDQLIGLVSPTAALRRAKRMRELGQGAEAFPLVARAARAGFADAEFWVAQSYLEGSGVPASRPEGVRWLKRAATHGSVDAQALLSSLYLQGLASEVSAEATNSAQSAQLFASDASTAPDFEAAATWARRAAGAGSAQGQALLGYILTSGPESMRNLDEAHRCYESSAAAGSPRVILDLPCHWRNAQKMRRAGAVLPRSCNAPPTLDYLPQLSCLPC